LISAVACNISLQFALPPFRSRLWQAGISAALVPVPEAAVHENHSVVLWHDYVWVAWQILPVQAETIAHAVEHRANKFFRSGVFAPDPAHIPRSMFSCKFIGHWSGDCSRKMLSLITKEKARQASPSSRLWT
jgi:hypothetical protein